MSPTEGASLTRLGDVLLVTLPHSLDDRLAADVREEVTERVAEEKLAGVVLDISSLEIIDSYMARILTDVSRSVETMGTRVLLAGMRPEIAMILVELGVSLRDLRTAVDVERAVERLAGPNVASASFSGDGRG